MQISVSQSQNKPNFGAKLKIYDYQNRLNKIFKPDELMTIQTSFAEKTEKQKGEIQYIAKYGNAYVPDIIIYMNNDYRDSIEIVRDSSKNITPEVFVEKMTSVLKVFKMKEAANADIAKLQKKIQDIEVATANYCSKIIKENFKTP